MPPTTGVPYSPKMIDTNKLSNQQTNKIDHV